jgi:ketosteroid isomerase-like protein
MGTKRVVVAIMVVMAALSLVSCAASAQADEKAFLDAVWGEIDMLNKGDVNGLMSYYAADAVKLPQGGPLVKGKAAIREGAAAFHGNFDVDFDFELVDYEIVGDYATRQGAWTNTMVPRAGGDPVKVQGKCMLGWKKIDGEWKIVWEIFNTDG